jgi:hypothetical protein
VKTLKVLVSGLNLFMFKFPLLRLLFYSVLLYYMSLL